MAFRLPAQGLTESWCDLVSTWVWAFPKLPRHLGGCGRGLGWVLLSKVSPEWLREPGKKELQLWWVCRGFGAGLGPGLVLSEPYPLGWAGWEGTVHIGLAPLLEKAGSTELGSLRRAGGGGWELGRGAGAPMVWEGYFRSRRDCWEF